EHVVGDAGPSILFVLGPDIEDGLLDRLEATVGRVGLTAPIIVFGDDRSRETSDGSRSLFTAFLATGEDGPKERLARAPEAVSPEDASILVYTSGTTGAPKGAMVRHSGLSRLSHIQSRRWGIERPRIIINQPINHIGCVGDLCSVSLHARGTLIFTDRFDPA